MRLSEMNYSSQSNSKQDNDSRMHRIINNAKFEVDEIQRRLRHHETDTKNIFEELAKMLECSDMQIDGFRKSCKYVTQTNILEPRFNIYPSAIHTLVSAQCDVLVRGWTDGRTDI